MIGMLVSPGGAVQAFDPLAAACRNAGGSGPICQQNKEQQNPANKTNPAVRIMQSAANIIAVVGGVAAVIIIIISGFMFVTAGGSIGGQRAGDTNRAKQARSALTGAVIGLLIIAFAWTIVTLVTSSVIK